MANLRGGIKEMGKMINKLPEWFNLMYQIPGEKYPLDEVGKNPASLSDALESIDMKESLHWSGNLYGDPLILENIIKTQKYDIKIENVLAVNGGTNMGIFLACMALLEQGDEVICESPAWAEVETLCDIMGIQVNKWFLKPENNWKPDLDDLKTIINKKTKLIYINHPNNPTGSLISDGEMIELSDIASKYGTYILSDEVYRGLEWNNNKLSPSIVNFYDRGIVASSLTKTIGATGIRFGWIATRDKDLYDRCFLFHYNSVLCNNIMSERIGKKLLEPSRFHKILEQGKTVGIENLKILSEMVHRNNFWSMPTPGGGYTCFIKYNGREPSWDFCERVLKIEPIGVYLVPGICYNNDCEYHIRIGFGAEPELFKTGLRLLEETANASS